MALNFKLHGVTYTLRKASDTAPLQDRCKSLDEVVADLTTLQGLAENIRVSSITDCNTGDIVLRALAQVGGNLRVWLGLDVGSTGQDFEFERSILLALLSTRNVTSVVGLTVLVSDETSLTVNQTIQFRNDLKDDLISQGLGDRPVTIGYPLDTMLANPELATVDESIVYFHDTSYRDSTTTINEAATDLSNRVDQLLGTINGDTIVNNRRMVVGATGWPDGGTTATSANRPSLRKWLRDVVCLAQDRGWDYYWDTAYDATRVFDDGRGHLGLLQEQAAEPPTVSTLKSYLVDYSVDCSQPAVPLEDPTSDVFPPPPTAAPTQSPTLAPTVPLPSAAPSTLPSVVPTTSVPPTIATMVPSARPTRVPTTAVPTRTTSAAPTRESERVASNQQGNDDDNNTDENATTDNTTDDGGGGKKRENLLELSILGAVAGALVGALVLIVQNRRRRAQDDKTLAYQSKRHADDDDEEEPHVLDVTSDELSYLYQGQEDDATTVDQPVEVKELDTSSQASPLLKVAEVPVEEPPPEEESIQDGKQCLVYVRERETGVKVLLFMDLTFLCVCVPVWFGWRHYTQRGNASCFEPPVVTVSGPSIPSTTTRTVRGTTTRQLAHHLRIPGLDLVRNMWTRPIGLRSRLLLENWVSWWTFPILVPPWCSKFATRPS